MAHLKSWWYRPDHFTNFGDELGAIFLQELGHTVERVPFHEADIFTTGSILQLANRWSPKKNAIVWGTGWHKHDLFRRFDLDVRAVRGPLTASQLGVDVPYGDPGILASHFWPRTIMNVGRIGWVPHYADPRSLPGTQRIDVRNDPKRVCAEIATCETVVSSSLHGCIIAAAYGIPYMRIHHPKVNGGETKWIDFNAGLNASIETIQQRLLESIGDL